MQTRYISMAIHSGPSSNVARRCAKDCAAWQNASSVGSLSLEERVRVRWLGCARTPACVLGARTMRGIQRGGPGRKEEGEPSPLPSPLLEGEGALRQWAQPGLRIFPLTLGFLRHYAALPPRPRPIWAAVMAIALGALLAACADGRGSTGFDITDRASRIEAASTVAVSNLDTLIAFGGGSNGGGASCSGSRAAAAVDSGSPVLPDESEALCTEEGTQDFQCVEEDGLFTATRFLLGTPRAPSARPA